MAHPSHEFELRDGRWYCTTENVDANACEDDDRCSYTCVCNTKEFDVALTVTIQVQAHDDEAAKEEAMAAVVPSTEDGDLLWEKAEVL